MSNIDEFLTSRELAARLQVFGARREGRVQARDSRP